MPSNATFDIAYPQNMMFFLHTCGAFSFIINSFGVFIVLKKSPRLYTTYKNCVLYIQIWSTFADAYLSFFMCPVPILPIIAIYSLGWMTDLGVTTHIQLTIMLFTMTNQASAIACSFIIKHQAVLPIGSVLKLSKNLQRIVLATVTAIFVVPMTIFSSLSGLSLELQKLTVREDYPMAMNIFQLDALQVHSSKYNNFVVFAMSHGVWLAVLSSVALPTLVFHIFYILDRQKYQMSSKTHEMHRRTTINLILQLCVPCFSYVTPVFTIVCILLWNIGETQVLGKVCTCILSTHSICATITMISSQKHYRDGVISALRGRTHSHAKGTSVVRM